MGIIKKEIHKCYAALIVGKGLGGVLKEIWNCIKKLGRELDRIFAVAAREIMKRRLPVVPTKVFFHTQEGKYTCNPKYICEELRRREADVDIVWKVAGEGDKDIPAGIRTVRLNSYQYFEEIFSAKIVVTNSFLYLGEPVFLKKDQILIETWHGSLGIKRHDSSAMKDSWRRVQALKKTGKMTSYCISNSSLETGSLRSTYWPDTPILEYGHARNDLFFENHAEERRIIRKKLFKMYNLSPLTNIVMYAPTFRDDQNFDCYGIDFNQMFTALENRFGGHWCLFLRYHPSLFKVYEKQKKKVININPGCQIVDGKGEPAVSRGIVDVTKYPDMQELIAVTDVAITDYSSWIYDFVLLRKPGFIFATDIEKYNHERGFYYPLEETPFPIARDNDELEKNILSFEEDSYGKKIELFLQDKGCVEDGHASERAVDKILELLHGEDRRAGSAAI